MKRPLCEEEQQPPDPKGYTPGGSLFASFVVESICSELDEYYAPRMAQLADLKAKLQRDGPVHAKKEMSLCMHCNLLVESSKLIMCPVCGRIGWCGKPWCRAPPKCVECGIVRCIYCEKMCSVCKKWVCHECWIYCKQCKKVMCRDHHEVCPIGACTRGVYCKCVDHSKVCRAAPGTL